MGSCGKHCCVSVCWWCMFQHAKLNLARVPGSVRRPMPTDQVQHLTHVCRYNPAGWMLEVTSPDAEATTGVNFSQQYRESEQAK